jgi:dTDP-4-dehydrorhamnose reductase
MRILLTGSGGQVGRALVTALAPLGEVIATDRASLDLSQPEQLRAKVVALRPDLVVNAAAYTDVERAETEEPLAVTVNAISVGQLATAAHELDIPLIHYSTDYVFDGMKASAYLEDDVTRPLSAYGRSKVEGENRIRQSGCAHLILRTSWVYSAGGRNFLTTMLRLAAEREELRIVDDQIGAPTFAGFIAVATAQMAEQMTSDGVARRRVAAGETVHLVNGNFTSWFGFASEIFASAVVTRRYHVPRLVAITTSEFPTRAIRPRNSRLSTERAMTQWRLRIPDWRESLAECLDQLDQADGVTRPKSSEKRTMSSSPR